MLVCAIGTPDIQKLEDQVHGRTTRVHDASLVD
jgi:hypothetical protein